jgi:hypothetical protein
VSNNQTHLPLDAPSPTDALRNRSEPCEIKEEHVHCNDQSFSPSYEKISDPAYQSIQNSRTTTDNMECAGDRSKLTGKKQQVCQVIFNDQSIIYLSICCIVEQITFSLSFRLHDPDMLGRALVPYLWSLVYLF